MTKRQKKHPRFTITTEESLFILLFVTNLQYMLNSPKHTSENATVFGFARRPSGLCMKNPCQVLSNCYFVDLAADGRLIRNYRRRLRSKQTPDLGRTVPPRSGRMLPNLEDKRERELMIMTVHYEGKLCGGMRNDRTLMESDKTCGYNVVVVTGFQTFTLL